MAPLSRGSNVTPRIHSQCLKKDPLSTRIWLPVLQQLFVSLQLILFRAAVQADPASSLDCQTSREQHPARGSPVSCSLLQKQLQHAACSKDNVKCCSVPFPSLCIEWLGHHCIYFCPALSCQTVLESTPLDPHSRSPSAPSTSLYSLEQHSAHLCDIAALYTLQSLCIQLLSSLIRAF